jgi:hypothetical protein
VKENQGLWVDNREGGVIGNEMLRRFDVTIDFPQKRLFLKKNAHFDDPYIDPHAELPDGEFGFWSGTWVILVDCFILILGLAVLRMTSSSKVRKGNG